jgi:hypothetical protein
MLDSFIAIVVIAAVFIGLPVLILTIMDRGGKLSNLLLRIAGVISLLSGLTIFAWFAYNLVCPTSAFEISYKSVIQLSAPVVLVWVGWTWAMGERFTGHRN